jgi:YVTN family beta-propeller protein
VLAASSATFATSPCGAVPVVKRASSAIAITPDGTTLVVANPDSATISLVETASGTVTAEVDVGIDPRTVAIDETGRRAFVANYGSATVSVVDLGSAEVLASIAVGPRPYGVVADPAGQRAFVAEQGSSTVAVLEGPDWQVVDRLPVLARPSGVAVTADGATLLVTHLLEPVITVLEVGSWNLHLVELWPDSNLLQSVVLTPGDATALLPHTRSNTSNRQLTFDTTVFPLVSKVDVAARRHLAGQHLSLDTIDPPGVGLPFDAAVNGDATAVWIVNAASNDLTVADPTTGTRFAHIEVGDNPRGIVLSPDGLRAFVTNSLAGTVSVIDTGSHAVIATWPVSKLPLPPAMLAGKRLFWSSDDPRMARAQWIGCASCHFDGEHDGRTWQFGFAGPRNTTSLLGMVQSYPLRWSAEWDESADSDFAVTEEQFGSGLLDGAMHHPLAAPNAERSFELDALAAFLDGLQMPANDIRATLDPDAISRGEALFTDPVTACASCHPAPYFTDFRVHDVGTADCPDERLGPEIDTPTLRDLARSAPYLHDGSCADLRDVLTAANPDDLHGVTSHLGAQDVDDLAAFLLSLPANNDARRNGGVSPLGNLGRHSHAGAPSTSHPRRASGRLTPGPVIAGRVVRADDLAPVAGALVTVRATELHATTNSSGRFVLPVPTTDGAIEVAAWADGFYIASVVVTAPVGEIELALRALHDHDHPDYDWIDPNPDPTVSAACGNCHPMILPQWSGNAHGGAVSNPRFFSLYNGAGISGSAGVSIPGYKRDFPGTNGVCAACHAPGAAVDSPFSTDMNSVRGRIEAGIHCDLCHKIRAARLQPATRAVYPNMAGVLSLEVLRPPPGDQVFFGPFADIHDPDTFAPAMRDGGFCAPCHQFSFWGTPIYTSYDEWRASPYADPETGTTCQGCHMAPTGDTFFALPDQGGLEHPPETIPSHLQLGLSRPDFMSTALTLDVDVHASASELIVTATVINSGTGHHLPTDHPGRHLLLEVRAVEPGGTPLSLLDGPVIPFWGGGLAGLPGTGYAKLLEDVATGEWPVVSYWKHSLIRQDTRLEAFASDRTVYRFARPPGPVSVTVVVRFRRLFEELARGYGWDVGELTLAERTVRVPAS